MPYQHILYEVADGFATVTLNRPEKHNGMDLEKGIIDKVCDLITSANVESATPGTRFLWDIVANKRNSIDVDKFEYLLRDQHGTGVKGNVDVVGRKSPYSLFDEKIATFEEDHGTYDQADAEGFIKLNALRLRNLARKRSRS